MKKSASQKQPRVIELLEDEVIILKTATCSLKLNTLRVNALKSYICEDPDFTPLVIDTLTTAMFDLTSYKIKQIEGLESEFYLAPELIDEIRNIIDFHRMSIGQSPLA